MEASAIHVLDLPPQALVQRFAALQQLLPQQPAAQPSMRARWLLVLFQLRTLILCISELIDSDIISNIWNLDGAKILPLRGVVMIPIVIVWRWCSPIPECLSSGVRLSG